MYSSAFLLPTPLSNSPSPCTTATTLPSHKRHPIRHRPRRPQPPRLHPSATAASAAASTSPQNPRWQTHHNLDLYIPQAPSLILIFIGGLAASLSPRVTYSAFLTRLSNTTNAAILAHRTPPSSDHSKLVRSIVDDVTPHLSTLRSRFHNIPTFTIGHSLGAKLTLLASTDHTCREALAPITANIMISFCNRSTADVVPWSNQSKAKAADTLSNLSNFFQNVDVSIFQDARADSVRQNLTNVIDAVEKSLRSELTPTPDETLALVGGRYNVTRNLVISFDRDELDDGVQLVRVLKSRFGDNGVVVRTLQGTHVTPMTPELGDGEGAFYKSGNRNVDNWVEGVGQDVGQELHRLIAVVAAFLQLQIQIG